MRTWLICAATLTGFASAVTCQGQTSTPVGAKAPAAKLEFRPMPKLDDGTWVTRPAETSDHKSPDGWDFEEIIESATGKLVSRDELEKTLFKKAPFLDGSRFKPNTRADIVGTGNIVIHFEFKDDAKETFKEYTGTHIGKHLGIFYDHQLISAPIINDAIPGVGIIEGNFTPEAAQRLADQLNVGVSPKSQGRTGVQSLIQSPVQTLLLVAGGIGLVLLPILYFWSRSADKLARPVE
jgi:hypothetical protein